MSAATKLALFAAVLALAFGGGASLGAAVGPIDVDGVEVDADHDGAPGGH